MCIRNPGKTRVPCPKGVGTTCIFRGCCSSWVLKKCSGIPGCLKPGPSYRCKRCTKFTVGNEKLEVGPSFCYRGDCLSSGGGCELSSVTYAASHGANSMDYCPSSRPADFPITSRRRIYNSCVRSAMLHASQTWVPILSHLHRLQSNDRVVVR